MYSICIATALYSIIRLSVFFRFDQFEQIAGSKCSELHSVLFCAKLLEIIIQDTYKHFLHRIISSYL